MVRLAQIFEVYDQFVPTKASVYLRPKLSGDNGYFSISDDISIDSLNFSVLSQGVNKLFPSDTDNGLSGAGYLYVDTLDVTGGYASVGYPIQAISSGQYRLWLRTKTTTGEFRSVISLDSLNLGNLNNLSASAGWEWNSLIITITDTETHTLTIEPTVDGSFVDKIYITSDLTSVPVGFGEDFSTPQYVTIHAQLYTVNGSGEPDSPLFIYDQITTISDLKTDDWYNFNLNFLDSSRAVSFSDRYSLVLYTSGSNSDQYIVWDISDSDPDVDSPSAIKA
jgi:hypothetical protein